MNIPGQFNLRRPSVTNLRFFLSGFLILVGMAPGFGQTTLSPRIWSSVELFSPVRDSGAAQDPDSEVPEPEGVLLYPKAGIDLDLLGYADFATFDARLSAQVPILQYNPGTNKITYQGSNLPQINIVSAHGTVFLGDSNAFWMEYGDDPGFYSVMSRPAVHTRYTDITRQGLETILSTQGTSLFPRLRLGIDLYHGPLTVRLWTDPLRPPAIRPALDSPWYPKDQFDTYREEFDEPYLTFAYQPVPQFHGQEYVYSDPRIHGDDLSFGLDLTTQYQDLEWFFRWYSGWNNRYQYQAVLDTANPNQPRVNLTQYLHRAHFLDTGFRLTLASLQLFWEGSFSPTTVMLTEPVLNEEFLRLDSETLGVPQLSHAAGFVWNTALQGLWLTGELGLLHLLNDHENLRLPDFSRTLTLAATYNAPGGFLFRAGSLYDLTQFPQIQGAVALAQIGYAGTEGLELSLSVPFFFAHVDHPLYYYTSQFATRLDVSLRL